MSDLVGQEAPDFTLRNQDGKKVTLSDLRGQTVVLVFYPLDWSPVCTDQLNLYQDAIADFKKQDATLYGIAEGLRVASVLVLPFMPESAERVLEALGQPEASLDRARDMVTLGAGRIVNIKPGRVGGIAA